MPFQYVHRHCGGTITVWRMRCQKCRKQWNPISFMLTNSIRPVQVESKRKPTAGAKWGDKLPVVNVLVRYLPNWPRWARILAIFVIVGIVLAIIQAVC